MRNLKRLLVFLSTGTMAVVLAACYGMPVDYMYEKIVRARDQSNQPINGLEISLIQPNTDTLSSFTNEKGEAQFSIYQGDDFSKLNVEDIDGVENGGEFESLELNFENSEDTLDIILNKKSGE